MPSQYNGNTANIQFPTSKNVSTTTGNLVSPIVVTTTVAHGLTTNDLVNVSKVQGNTAANGTWPIQVVNATQFILVGSTGNGAYTTGGTVQSLADGATYQQPSDGDAPSAASVNTGTMALGDRTATNRAAVGQFKLFNEWATQVNDATENASWMSLQTLSATSTWQSLVGLASPAQGILQAGDVIEADLSATWVWADAGNSGTGMLIGLGIGYSVAGALPVSGTIVVGSGQVLSYPGSNGIRTSQRLYARATVPANVQTAELFLMGYTRGGTPSNFTVQGFGSYAMVGSIWRPTGFPQ